MERKGVRRKGRGARVRRVEYKHSRDYKVTLFCSLLPVSCDKRLTTELCVQLCVLEKRKLLAESQQTLILVFYPPSHTDKLNTRTHSRQTGRLSRSSVANRSLAGLQHLITLIRINDKTPKQSITSDCNAISYQRVGGCLKRLDECLSIRPFKCSQALMNEVVTNNLLRWVAAQVLFRRYRFLHRSQGEISPPYSKFHELLFSCVLNNNKYF